ncbi:hypothetical protein C9422_21850 [Pseudomonas sp. B1(2018)]|nr:hypothetical protein C9422_21850 [Pseudomonas sp. B1(2018)]
MGASLLAMVVNDNAGFQDARVALKSIASRLAPTQDLREAIISLWRLPSWPTNFIPAPIRRFTSPACRWKHWRALKRVGR